MPWQKHCLTDMLAIDKDGKFRRKTIGVLVARQNGKTFLAVSMILGHLFLWGSKNVIGMSSNRNMALDVFREVAAIIEGNDFLKEQVAKIRFANGTEVIQLKNGAKYEIVAATRDGSRGKHADFLYVDELREVSEEAWTAVRPLTRATQGVTMVTSNAGDMFSTVLNDLRSRALSYPSQTFGWYEYSAPDFCKIDDRSVWALANPALGHTITEETLEEAVATNSAEATKTEMLCVWVESLESPFPMGVIEATSLSDLKLPVGMPTYFAFDVSPSKRQCSLVGAQIMADGKIGVGLIQTWTSDIGVDELKIASDIHEWSLKYRPQGIGFDKYATASIAAKLEQQGWKMNEISGQHFYQACSDLLDAFVNNRIVHSGQPELVAMLNGCGMKTNDAGWRIVRRKSSSDVSGAIGLAMLVYMLNKPQSTAEIYF
jgi:phage terminase large subunit-like protein